MTILDIVFLVLGLLILFVALAVVVLIITWLERKVLGRIQRRIGPQRVGPFGLLQPVADALKLILKEDLMPSWADRIVFWVAPLVVFVPAFVIWFAIPGDQNLVIFKITDATNFFELGLFYIIAFSTISIVGLVMAGWSSGNKYATLGGLRSAAQLISYEIPVIMVAISVAMMAQSIDLEKIANAQMPGTDAGNATWPHIPFFAAAPLGLVIFLIASLAEAGRSPFDIYTAESELVGGPFIEYSGAHWAAFFLVEYLNVFVVAVLTTLLFLGAWHGPWLPGWLWFAIKASVMVVVVIWIRGTFPRLRVDQLMAFSWKALIPLSFVNIGITAVYLFYGWPTWSLTLMSLGVLLAACYYLYRKLTAPALRAGAQAFQRAGGR